MFDDDEMLDASLQAALLSDMERATHNVLRRRQRRQSHVLGVDVPAAAPPAGATAALQSAAQTSGDGSSATAHDMTRLHSQVEGLRAQLTLQQHAATQNGWLKLVGLGVALVGGIALWGALRSPPARRRRRR